MKEIPEIIKMLREEENEHYSSKSSPTNHVFIEKHESENNQETTSKYTSQSGDQFENIQLHNLRQIYDAIFDNSTFGIIIMDADELIISWNKRSELLLNDSNENLFLQPFWSLFTSSEGKRIRNEFIQYHGVLPHIETVIENEHYPKITVDLSLNELKNETGNHIGTVCIIRDISEQKKIGLQLKESEQKFKKLYENAPISYHSITPAGVITNVNERWCQILGYSKEEVIGKLIFDFIAEEEREQAIASFHKKIIYHKQQYSRGSERTYVTKNGDKKIFLIEDFFSYDDDHNVTSINTTMEDITEQKQIEEDLRIWQAAIESSINGIVITDLDGLLTYCNPSFLQMWRYEKPQEIIGKPVVHFWKNKGKYVEILDALLEGDGWRQEIEGERKDGSSFYVQLSAALVKTKDDQPLCMLASFTDISERKRVEKELEKKAASLQTANYDLAEAQKTLEQWNQELEKKVQERTIELSKTNTLLSKEIKEHKESLKKLKQSQKRIERQNIKLKKLDKIKSDFLNITSHELRTPMSSIKGYTQMILRETLGPVSQDQVKGLHVVLRNADRLDNLIRDILDISRLESGTMKFIPEKTDIQMMVMETIETMQTPAKMKDITLHVDLDDEMPVLTIDGERIKQVLINLLNNAIKFSTNDSEVFVSVSKTKDHLEFSVKDQGRGIPKKKQRKIFDTFYQVDSGMDRKFGGAGLGLAICRGIILAHGGTISVESQLKKGSTFIFTLPLIPVTDVEGKFREVDIFSLEENHPKQEAKKKTQKKKRGGKKT